MHAGGIRMVSDDNVLAFSARACGASASAGRRPSSISANTKISASLFEGLSAATSRAGPPESSAGHSSRLRRGGPDPTWPRGFLSQSPHPPAPPAPAAPAEPAPAAALARPETTTLRLKLADAPTPFLRGRLLSGMRHSWAAVACDGGFVVAIALCAFIAFDKFWLPLGVAMLTYYLGGILLLGNTPGVCLFAPGEAGGAHYNQPSDEPNSEPGPPHPSWHFRMPAR